MNRLFASLLCPASICAFLFAAFVSSADTTPYVLSNGTFSQDWSSTGAAITVNDDWSGVPSIVGYLGDFLPTSPTALDPQTNLVAGSSVDVIANQSNPATQSTGGVGEFDGIANPTVALQGSGTADFPNLVVYVNTLGMTGVSISYNLRDIDAAVDNAVQPVALQYRIGTSGDFVNVPGAFVADASTGPSLATLVTPVSASNPLWDNQSEVQFRIITGNAVGSDEWIGIDDITITGTAVPEPSAVALIGTAGLLALAVRRRSK